MQICLSNTVWYGKYLTKWGETIFQVCSVMYVIWWTTIIYLYLQQLNLKAKEIQKLQRSHSVHWIKYFICGSLYYACQ
jgi:hypothetical protein